MPTPTIAHVTYIFGLLLLTKVAVQLWLNFRNERHVRLHRHQVPEEFAGSITLAEHQKAADYTLEKSRFGNLCLVIDALILFGWTLGGGLNYLNNLIVQSHFSSTASALILFGAFGLISLIIGLPESIYSTFVIEEKFGFNKTTPKTFVADLIKQVIISVVLGLPLLWAIISIMNSLGNMWWPCAWALFTGFQLLIMWIYPSFIAPLFNKFTPMQDGELKERIERLLGRAGFGHSGLYVMDASKRSNHGNAYFTGFGKNKRIVFFDTLISNLEHEEVESVLAHELGHFKHKHIVKGFCKAMLISLLALFVLHLLKESALFYQGHGVEAMSTGMALMLFMLVLPIYMFWPTPILARMSRKNEFQADEFASKHARADKLVSALIKLYKDNASTLTPDPVYAAFYYSHPQASERIKALVKNSK